jgi:uncharacterized membrane protein
MEIKITLFFTLVLYSFVVGQSFFYILALSRAAKNMRPVTYIESRQLIDKNLQVTLRFVYYLALIASIALTSFCVINPSGTLFICSVISLLLLITDIVLSLKGNTPLNKAINSWTASDYPANWKEYRSKWFCVYNIRQAANITGFIALLAGLIFGFY